MPIFDAIARARDTIRRRIRGVPPIEARLPTELLGSDYGGYAVCRTDLHEGSVVYSFGIGEDVSFDLAMIERFGVMVHAFDPTPRSIEWVKSQPLPPRFVLHPFGLAGYDGRARFTPPENPEHISHTLLPRSRSSGAAVEVEVYRLRTILERLSHERVDVLKMDIEGAEYDVIDDILESGVRVGQLLVEFHHHLPEVPLARTRRSLRRLRRAGYRVFHVSESGHELSFIGPR